MNLTLRNLHRHCACISILRTLARVKPEQEVPPMSSILGNERQLVHLTLGGAAVALAVALRDRGWGVRVPLVGLAALELRNALYAPVPVRAAAEDSGVPELVHSAMVGNILMRWEEHGPSDGLPVVLVHGIPTHPRLWRHVIPRVAGSYVRCLAWEMVGYGWSMAEGLERDISIGRQAVYLRAWLQHLGIERAIFVGHDIGGGVIQRLLVEHPELTSGLVLADSVAYDNWPVPAVRAAQRISGLLPYLPPALVKPFFARALGNLGHDERVRGAESAAIHWQPYTRALGPRAFAHQLRSLDPRDTMSIAHALPRLDVPARIVWGERDPLGLPAAEQLAADLGAPLRHIPGARHFTPEDHPDALAAAIREVITQVAGRAAARLRPMTSPSGRRPVDLPH
jgi:pimeloyl-ACP methyl ester carboxylesterase